MAKVPKSTDQTSQILFGKDMVSGHSGGKGGKGKKGGNQGKGGKGKGGKGSGGKGGSGGAQSAHELHYDPLNHTDPRKAKQEALTSGTKVTIPPETGHRQAIAPFPNKRKPPSESPSFMPAAMAPTITGSQAITAAHKIPDAPLLAQPETPPLAQILDPNKQDVSSNPTVSSSSNPATPLPPSEQPGTISPSSSTPAATPNSDGVKTLPLPEQTILMTPILAQMPDQLAQEPDLNDEDPQVEHVFIDTTYSELLEQVAPPPILQTPKDEKPLLSAHTVAADPTHIQPGLPNTTIASPGTTMTKAVPPILNAHPVISEGVSTSRKAPTLDKTSQVISQMPETRETSAAVGSKEVLDVTNHQATVPIPPVILPSAEEIAPTALPTDSVAFVPPTQSTSPPSNPKKRTVSKEIFEEYQRLMVELKEKEKIRQQKSDELHTHPEAKIEYTLNREVRQLEIEISSLRLLAERTLHKMKDRTPAATPPEASAARRSLRTTGAPPHMWTPQADKTAKHHPDSAPKEDDKPEDPLVPQ